MMTAHSPSRVERQCLVSRQTGAISNMVRFVLDPEANVIADIRQNLPGRGVWIMADRELVDKATKSGLFAKGFKQTAHAAENLGEIVERVLIARLIQNVAMANKAGMAVNGFSKVNSAIRSNRSLMMFHASDASIDGHSKMITAINSLKMAGLEEDELPDVSRALDCEQLAKAMGKGNVVHVALLKGGASRAAKATLEQLDQYRS